MLDLQRRASVLHADDAGPESVSVLREEGEVGGRSGMPRWDEGWLERKFERWNPESVRSMFEVGRYPWPPEPTQTQRARPAAGSAGEGEVRRMPTGGVNIYEPSNVDAILHIPYEVDPLLQDSNAWYLRPATPRVAAATPEVAKNVKWWERP